MRMDALSFYKEAFEQTCKKKLDDIDNSLYTVREFGLLYKIASISDHNLLFKLGYFLKKLNDNNYLKVVYYGELISELVSESENRWMKQVQLEYIESALQYKRLIKQSKGVVRLLELKKKYAGELSEEEETILKFDNLLGWN